MSENKTKPTDLSYKKFLSEIENPRTRRDCEDICSLMSDVSGWEPVMWGSSMVGFGKYHYKYDSGREGDSFVIGFSPRKQNLTLYFMDGFDKHDALLDRLGKFKISKSCLYIKHLDDVDTDVLRQLAEDSIKGMRATGFPVTTS